MLTDDLAVRRRLRELARKRALTIGEEQESQPALAVIDLQLPNALDVIRDWRARWPDVLLASFLGVPDRDRWVAAQRAGCDLVVNRGALLSRLRDRLARGDAEGSGLFPLLDAADTAGRLGLVHRAADTPVGPVAVFRVAGRLYAIADRCPHAGAALSGGDVDSAVVTCPRHGSQFDITTGERVRGPADSGVACYPLAEQAGQVFLVVRAPGGGP